MVGATSTLRTCARRPPGTIPAPENRSAGYIAGWDRLGQQTKADAIEFYTPAFDAEELMRFEGPDGGIAHAELQIGDSRIMVADENPQMGFRSPQSLGGSGIGIMVYVDDVDRVFTRALDAGAKAHQEVRNQFYGSMATDRAR